jgi:hypothetical protein
VGGAFDDLADDLVAGNERLMNEGEIALEDVEIGATDSASEDAEEEMVFGEGGAGDFFDLKRLVRGVENCGFHGNSLFAIAF